MKKLTYNKHLLISLSPYQGHLNLTNENYILATTREMESRINPEIASGFTEPTTEFLCELSANIYDIRFGNFKIRDASTNNVFFYIERDFLEQTEETRFIQYYLPSEILTSSAIGTEIYFSVGEYPVHNFRIVEKHFFRGRILQSYDFNIEFLIPNTVNSREFIYSLPELPQDLIADIMMNPFEVKSDTFFFVENELIMHVRAEYDYSG